MTGGGRWKRLGWRVLFGPIMRVIPFRAARLAAYPLTAAALVLNLRRDVVRINLALAFPSLSERQLRRLVRRALLNVATVLLELPLLRYLSDRSLTRWISFEGLELITGTLPRGLILLSGHVGNWELLALASGWMSGRPFAIVVKEQNDGGELNRTRTVRGNTVIATSRAARAALDVLSEGGGLAMLADQSAAPPDPLVSIFDIPTYFFGTPARLALRFRPRVVCGFAVRRSDGGYHVRIRELAHDDLDDTSEGRDEFTRRYARALEEAVKTNPDLWLWTHRRWKYTPGVNYRT